MMALCGFCWPVSGVAARRLYCLCVGCVDQCLVWQQGDCIVCVWVLLTSVWCGRKEKDAASFLPHIKHRQNARRVTASDCGQHVAATTDLNRKPRFFATFVPAICLSQLAVIILQMMPSNKHVSDFVYPERWRCPLGWSADASVGYTTR